MTPAEELELVKNAILLGQTVGGCCEWHERTVRRVEDDIELVNFPPSAIRRLLIEYVCAGGIIRQVKEQRPEYGEFEFYYKVIVPAAEFPHGLFVEIRLTDADVDCPTVMLVNAHPQRK